MHDSERLDLPSASEAYARRRCLGRTALIRQLRNAGKLQPPPESDDAKSGTQVHQAWASGNDNGLSSSQRNTLDSLIRIEKLVVANWAGGEPYSLLSREDRLWLHKGLEPIHSGRYDVAYVSLNRKRMLIIDGKTLYGQVEAADTNDQLRELVALCRHNFPGIEEFTVAIVQPNVPGGISIAAYDALESELALRLLRQHLEDIKDPYHQRNPGPYCKFCPAALQCPQMRGTIYTVADTIKGIQAGDFDLPLGPRGALLLARIKLAKPLLDLFESAYKAALEEDPGAVPNWRLREGKNVRRISDIKTAWQVAHVRGMELDAFLESVELSVGKLEAAYGQIAQAKGKALTQKFNQAFEPVIERQQYAPELEETK
ncbi:MAG TPA: DUF2800 domain-containing protein [Chthoniobacterales bacterium]|nr:DUF2800 domain-containing protein [Chthoniobacterales bacterium]